MANGALAAAHRARRGCCSLCAAAALAPWAIRNYRLTGMMLPTSVHGGVQLWYGTLQVGPFLNSRAYNPRSVFEAPAFDYTSLDGRSDHRRGPGQLHRRIARSTSRSCTGPIFSRRPARIAPIRSEARRYTFEIPAPDRDAVIYYYFVTTWSQRQGSVVRTTPDDGPRAPFVYFVSNRSPG